MSNDLNRRAYQGTIVLDQLIVSEAGGFRVLANTQAHERLADSTGDAIPSVLPVFTVVVALFTMPNLIGVCGNRIVQGNVEVGDYMKEILNIDSSSVTDSLTIIIGDLSPESDSLSDHTSLLPSQGGFDKKRNLNRLRVLNSGIYERSLGATIDRTG